MIRDGLYLEERFEEVCSCSSIRMVSSSLDNEGDESKRGVLSRDEEEEEEEEEERAEEEGAVVAGIAEVILLTL